MFVSFGGQLSSALVILGDEPASDQEWFGHLGNRACGQAQRRCQDVQSLGLIAQESKVCLLRWAEAQVVDSFEVASTMEVVAGDGIFTLCSTHPSASLQKP